MSAYVKPTTLQKIDALVDRKDAKSGSRGKIVDGRFER